MVDGREWRVVGEGWASGIPAGNQPRGGGGWLTGYRVLQDEKTPLHMAVEKGHQVVVALLAAVADKVANEEVRRGCSVSRGRCGVYWFVL